MKRLGLLLTMLLLLAVGRAAADCTKATSVTNTSTMVQAANTNGRHYLMLQNTGATIDVFCTVGQAAATTSNGTQIFHGGGAWVMGTGASAIPSPEVDCITASGTTTVVVCEF